MEYRITATTTVEHHIIIDAESYEHAREKANRIKPNIDFLYMSDPEVSVLDETFFGIKTEWKDIYTEDEYEDKFFPENLLYM